MIFFASIMSVILGCAMAYIIAKKVDEMDGQIKELRKRLDLLERG